MLHAITVILTASGDILDDEIGLLTLRPASVDLPCEAERPYSISTLGNSSQSPPSASDFEATLSP